MSDAWYIKRGVIYKCTIPLYIFCYKVLSWQRVPVWTLDMCLFAYYYFVLFRGGLCGRGVVGKTFDGSKAFFCRVAFMPFNGEVDAGNNSATWLNLYHVKITTVFLGV